MKSVPLFDEAELLQQIAEGSQRAFTVLFRQYSGKVYSFALRLTRSEELAEEVVQEIFLRIWLNRDMLTEIQQFGAYLSRMNRNHCLNAINRLVQEGRITAELSRLNTELSEETEQGIAYRSTQSLVDQAFQKLSPQQQKVYKLCHIDGLKYDEAASQLNISPGTVHTHMKMALKAIRQHLDKAGGIVLVCTLMKEFL